MNAGGLSAIRNVDEERRCILLMRKYFGEEKAKELAAVARKTKENGGQWCFCEACAAGATLGLDWPGVIEACRFRVSGRSLPEGTATAASAPDSLYGIGTVNVTPFATVIVIR